MYPVGLDQRLLTGMWKTQTLNTKKTATRKTGNAAISVTVAAVIPICVSTVRSISGLLPLRQVLVTAGSRPGS
jgi:hypothetical protein